MSEIGLHQELVGKLSPELVSQSEANLQDLLRCEEVRNLKFLSWGLARLLDECDYVFLDTNVLLNGVICFRTHIDWMKDYINKRREFNVISLSKVHYAHERGSDKRINLEELYESVQQDLLCGDLNLQILEEAFRCRPVMLSTKAFEEAHTNYTLARRQIALEVGKERPQRRHNIGLHVNRKSKGDIDARLKSEGELMSRRFGKVDRGIVECIRANMNRLSGILSFIDLANRIVEDSGIYNSPHLSDHRVIDSAMQYQGLIGIVTHDRGFEGKIEEVRRGRVYRELPVSSVYLLTGTSNLQAYKLLKITS